MNAPSPSTCQICARQIKSSKGTIAHHGFKMPHGRASGWRTSSCLGTHARPYEVACDRIPFVIQIVTEHVERDQKALADLIANPPAVLKTVLERYRKPSETLEVQKPESFEVKRPVYYVRNDYVSLFWARHDRLDREIKAANLDLEFFRARIAAWVAPAPVAS